MQNRIKSMLGQSGKQDGYEHVEITYIPTNQIRIANYQRRNVNRRAVERIATNFNPHLMRPIEVSARSGEYFCWDGQHRLSAYLKRGMDTIPCHVHTGLSYADEARLFVAQQQNVTSIKSRDIWNAMTEARDDDAINIVKCCKEFGLTVQPSLKAHNNVCAAKALQDVYKTVGHQGLRDVLYVLTYAWAGDKASLSSDNILGACIFLSHFGLFEDYGINRLADVLSKMTPTGFAARCGDYRAIKGGKARAAQVMLELYNRGLGSNSPHRLPKYQF